MNIANSVYRHRCENTLTFYMKKGEVDFIIGRNLKRLRNKENLTQEQLAEMLKIESISLISDWERGVKGIGKDVLERLCNIFDVRPYEFYIENDTPLPSSDLERKALYMAREAEKLGVQYIAEEAVEYTTHRLQVVKKQEGKGAGKSKATRLKVGNG